MARPQQKGLMYFPFDVAFFSDVKIKVLRSRYGTDGIALYIYLLCNIYKEGYYLKTDGDFNDVAAVDLGMTNEKIGLILNFLLGRSLFDDKLFRSDKVLTSYGIQRRFQEAVKAKALKKSVLVNERFWLLSDDETQSFIEVNPNANKSEINADKSEINSNKSEINATKESKVNKSKVNKIKTNKTKTNSADAVQEVFCLFNQICISLKPVSDLINYSREKATLSLLSEFNINTIKSVFEKVNASPFLCGEGPKKWKADFDWIIKHDKFVCIHEGKYDSTTDTETTSYDIDDIDKFWDKVPTI